MSLSNFVKFGAAMAMIFSLPYAHGADETFATTVYSDPFKDPLRVFAIKDPGTGKPHSGYYSAGCPSDTSASKPLDIDAAINIALCNNPQVSLAWAAIKAQAAQLGQAKSAYLPVISLTASRMRTGTTYPGSDFSSTSTSGEEYSGTLNWRLFDFGGRSATLKSSEALFDASVYDHAAALQKIVHATVQAYFDARNAKVEWISKLNEESLTAEILASAERRERDGISGHGDVLQASVRAMNVALDRKKALLSLKKCIATLVYAMGLPPNTTVDIPAEVALDDHLQSKRLSSGEKNLQAWLDEALVAHPEILAARSRVDAAKRVIDVARSDGMPTIDFSANVYQNGYPGQGLQAERTHINTIGLTVTVPLFDGFSHTYKVRAAQAQAMQREEEERDIEHSVALEMTNSYEEVAAAVDILRTSDDLLLVAQESMASAQRRYERGAADINELLNAQAALSAAKQDNFHLRLNYESACLRLLANAGNL